MSTPIYTSIIDVLTAKGVAFETLHHEPTRTSEDSARVRGESIAIGAKAILMKIDKTFHLFVISAAQRIDSKAIRKQLKAKKSRFASVEELDELTGLVPGSVPPFGRPILDFDLYADSSVFSNDRVAFNAGSLTDSVIMSSEDYRSIANPFVFDFAATS